MTIAPVPGSIEIDLHGSLDCAREPIRTPGAIQPRGALVVVDERDLRLRYASDNLGDYLGLPALDALGRCLPEIAPGRLGDTARTLLADDVNGRPIRLRLHDRVVDVFAHRGGEHAIIELEDVVDGETAATFDGFRDGVLDALTRFRHAADVHAVLAAAVSIVHDLTGFERVLAYRFEAEGHGVVEVERRADGLAPFLGLHFPASDIPPQARALYLEQWIRVIPDSASGAVDLVGPAGAAAPDSVDLSASVLRAVSPIHLQYLCNMGVRASLSVSLVVDGALWGLIVCHDSRVPRVVGYPVRAACEIVGITASMSIGAKAELAIVERRLELERVAALLLERVVAGHSLADGLLDEPELLLGVCDADGVAVCVDGEMRSAGSSPAEEDVARIQSAIHGGLADRAEFATDRLALDFPALGDLAGVASGVLAMNLSVDGANVILWFRPELISTVTWAGQPEKAAELSADSPRAIGPRRSFAAWAETVRARSRPWVTAEVAAVTTLRSSLGNLLLERAEQLAFALESTRRYERERSISEMLKENLRPAPLPTTPGLDVRDLYLPAGEGYGVSGDFFEVFPAPDGWFAVIGDVCGKGPRAAGVTTLARHSIRAIALQDPDVRPSRVVSVLNEAFMERAGGLFASVQVARMTPMRDGRVIVSLCSAGHPPALHRHGSTITQRSSRNVIVGARRGLPYHDIELELGPGDALILYTDGVTEAGRPDTMFGERRLAGAVASAGADSRSIVDAIRRAVLDVQVGELRDDIAVLCVRNIAVGARG